MKKAKTFSHTRISWGGKGGREQGQPATTKQRINERKTTRAENRQGEHTTKAGRTKEGKGGKEALAGRRATAQSRTSNKAKTQQGDNLTKAGQQREGQTHS